MCGCKNRAYGAKVKAACFTSIQSLTNLLNTVNASQHAQKNQFAKVISLAISKYYFNCNLYKTQLDEILAEFP